VEGGFMANPGYQLRRRGPMGERSLKLMLFGIALICFGGLMESNHATSISWLYTSVMFAGLIITVAGALTKSEK
jgi:hypothetical protein